MIVAKLYFRHGTVGSAKTLNLLAVAHKYQLQEKNILLLKPKVDVRYGNYAIKSRAGLERDADYLLDDDTIFILNNSSLSFFTPCYEKSMINLDQHKNVSCILVDEVQFLSTRVVDQLQLIALKGDIPVICYGLKTNFRSKLFEGSKRMLELADSIEEIKTTCHFCNKKAVFNLKFLNDFPVYDGPELQLGTEETYKPACKSCYFFKLSKFDGAQKH